MKKHYIQVAVLTIALTGLVGYNFMQAAWTPAPGSAPASNVDAPLNTGTGTQTKNGGLLVNTLAATGEIRSDRYCDSLGLNCVLGMASTTESSPVIQNVYTTVNSLWTKVGNLVQTISDVAVGGNLAVGGTISATDPSPDAGDQVATVSFLKALLATPYAYNDFGNLRGSLALPQVNYATMVEYYSDDQVTLDYICRYLGYDFGSTTGKIFVGGAGWNYPNLSVVTYDQTRGFSNGSSAFPDQRFRCFGTACSSTTTVSYASNVRCISKAKSAVQEKILTEVYLPAADLATFSKQITTRYVPTTYFAACVYGSRSDGLNYTASRTVRCYDSKTNAYVAGSQCIATGVSSTIYYPTLSQCNAGVTELNKVAPHTL